LRHKRAALSDRRKKSKLSNSDAGSSHQCVRPSAFGPLIAIHPRGGCGEPVLRGKVTGNKSLDNPLSSTQLYDDSDSRNAIRATTNGAFNAAGAG
jgi:hypothetical protein